MCYLFTFEWFFNEFLWKENSLGLQLSFSKTPAQIFGGLGSKRCRSQLRTEVVHSPCDLAAMRPARPQFQFLFLLTIRQIWRKWPKKHENWWKIVKIRSLKWSKSVNTGYKSFLEVALQSWIFRPEKIRSNYDLRLRKYFPWNRHSLSTLTR